MKRGVGIVLLVFVVYFSLKLFTSYTIFDVPYSFGTNTLVGGSKIKFPKCVINPLKKETLEKDILTSLKNNFESSYEFINKLHSTNDFEIISVNTDDKDCDFFLIEVVETNKKYALSTTKGTKRIVFIHD